MKRFKLLLVVLVALVGIFGMLYSQGFSPDNKPTPIFCASGTQKTVSVGLTSASVSTMTYTDLSRLDGCMQNLCTNYLVVSFTSNHPTTMASNYFLIYPVTDAYGRDQLPLKHLDNIYQGPIWFYAVESDLSTRGIGKAGIWSWK
jgi:hypothetical protein